MLYGGALWIGGVSCCPPCIGGVMDEGGWLPCVTPLGESMGSPLAGPNCMAACPPRGDAVLPVTLSTSAMNLRMRLSVLQQYADQQLHLLKCF